MAAQNTNVAIDGPVASGKTTVAKALAGKLGSLYLDTGAMYRSVAWLALREGIDADNELALVEAFAERDLQIVPDAALAQGYRVHLDGVEITAALSSSDVTSVVPTIAAHPRVRGLLAERQRAIARSGQVVMAGRDIGTVVLPDARYKFFLTASLEERIARRGAELHAAGRGIDADRLRQMIVERDRIDSSRATAPLRAADDAEQIDSTGMPVEVVIARMLERIESVV